MTTLAPRQAPGTWLALVTVYLVWGSTYLAIRLTVDDLPPLMAMGARFTVAALLLGVAMTVHLGWRAVRPTRRQLVGCGVVGVLLLLCGNGGVAVAEQRIDSGMAALVVATVPLWVVLIRVAARDRPGPMSLVGSVVGFGGIAILTLPSAGGRTGVGLLIVFCAALAWSIGSWLSPRLGLPSHPLVATTWEMLTGGLIMLAVGTLAERDDLALGDVRPSAWWAMVYLVLVGSLLGYTAFVWLLANAPISLTATYAYVNPVVAVALGTVFLDEKLTWAMLLGGSVVVAGVVLVVRGERPKYLTEPRPEPEPEPAHR